jgi:hypothetical protein
MAYLDWLSDARKALVLGTDNFIARDFANPAEFLDPGRLLLLLGQLSLPELLGPHHDRCGACAAVGVLRTCTCVQGVVWGHPTAWPRALL